MVASTSNLAAIALSRDVPGVVRWMIDPIVRRVSKNPTLISLHQTEGAVQSSAESETIQLSPRAVLKASCAVSLPIWALPSGVWA
jgi:hypothetical protein